MKKTSNFLDPSRQGIEARNFNSRLANMVIGQDAAIDEVVQIYQMYQTGLAVAGRPICNLLFLGPTGTGKTRVVEAVAEVTYGNPKAIIKIDCAEFQHSHEIAKLIGSPPGYLGHRETHPLLSQEVLNQHHTDAVKISFVLFDEIEKASDALWNLLLGIMDKATLTLGDNRKVDFSRTMIFLTSNLGASDIEKVLKPKLGFNPGPQSAEELERKVTAAGREAARKKFTPEFMNRLDKVITFKSLGKDELRRILGIEMMYVQRRLFQANNSAAFVFTPTERANEYLLEEGTNSTYGARHLKRAIERLLVQPLSNLVASQQVNTGDVVKVDFDGNSLVFTKEAEGLPTHMLAGLVEAETAVYLERKAAQAETSTFERSRMSRYGGRF